MALTMQKSVLGRPTAVVVQSRPTVQRPARIVALAQPFAGRPRAAPKAGSLQIAQAVALREVDTVQKLQEEDADVAINAIRFLAIDGVNAAKSGHPGLPMGCAPMSYVIYKETMKYNPKNPKWFNRDRFVLSAGHGSMLQYALLHLTGYDSVSLDDCKNFRQWGSNTPGHPENFLTPGVEVTTGPLGQGVANAVGLAAAERHLAGRFNKPDLEIVDHYTYVIEGDGCNMEGISNEAASLAGHWGLGKLIVFYDDNRISIDGATDISFTEDVNARYEALGWHVQTVVDGNHDLNGIRKAIENAKAEKGKPSLIKVSTLIGYGSPNRAGTHDVHGAALGADETKATREHLQWNHEAFDIPELAYKTLSHVDAGASEEAEWNEKFAEYKQKYPEEAEEFETILSGKLPEGWEKALPTFTPEDKGDATRNHSQKMLNAAASVIPGFWGGSADLAPSNMTLMKAWGDFQKDSKSGDKDRIGGYAERNIRFGVREHAMGAICNGIALHTPGLIPYCATFFIFTDYMRSAIRMSALSEAGVLYVMTHDSIGLGEDGPTHQPVEHLASFRAMPDILMLRPGDGTETAGAYQIAIQNAAGVNNPKGVPRPSVLALSRQAMPNLQNTSIEGVAKGGYIVHGGEEKPDAIVMSTGSELAFAVEAAKELEGEGKKVRVVSMVSWELFQEQPESYRESVLPEDVTARVSIEAGSTFGWDKWVGPKGITIGVDTFGASAPGPVLYEKFGITPQAVKDALRKLL